jgi:hypothetical protein
MEQTALSQPMIRLVPDSERGRILATESDELFDAPIMASTKPKTIGEMTEDEFLVVFVRGYLAAERTKGEFMSQDDQSQDKGQHDNVFTSVLGTIGSVAHSVVDVAEGIMRGFVDITTLGTARRN